MKEITFEELMHNKFDALEEYGGFKLPTKHQKAILELMQNVREATIAECKNIPLKWTDLYYDENNRDMVSEPEVNIEAFDNLPTDRIKI